MRFPVASESTPNTFSWAPELSAILTPEGDDDILAPPRLIVFPLKYKSLNLWVGLPISYVLSNAGKIWPVASNWLKIYALSAAVRIYALSAISLI